MSSSSSLPSASEEQMEIIKRIQEGCNVIVDSVAGSGKTTTCLHIAKECPFLSILLLTYNKSLKAETRERVKSLGIRNLEVHSYNAMGVKYYNLSLKKRLNKRSRRRHFQDTTL
jgi:hypothetical protein